jgi:hypothetical protein
MWQMTMKKIIEDSDYSVIQMALGYFNVVFDNLT